MRQYLSFCTSKASTLSTSDESESPSSRRSKMYGTQSFMPQFLRQHLHFCTSKASKVSTLTPQSRSSGPVAILMGKLPTPTEST
jgi:hypothetical protein